MIRKKQRLAMLLLAALGLGTATALVLTAFEDNLVFFYSPSDLQVRTVGDRTFRLGGLVEPGSVQRQDDGLTIQFTVTDLANRVPVIFKGLLPDLFREGQGVIAEGKLGGDGVFQAREVLAKHDENYMPPEVADALQRAGAAPGDKAPPAYDVEKLSKTAKP